MRYQKRVKGGRVKTSASLERAVRREVERTAREHGVSMSFVENVALAEHFGIDVTSYVEVRPRLRRVK